MAKKKAAAAEPTDPAAAPTKSKKKILIPVAVLAIALLGAGAMAGGFIGGGVDEAAAAPTPTAEATTPELGMLVQLESVTLNLAEGRFLKLGVAVELAPEVAEAPPTAPIYDEVIELFAPLTFDALRTPEVRAQTKEALLAQLAGVYGPDIVNVYFTEFVMQ